LVDPRGSGRSDRPLNDDGYQLADYAADLETLRRHLELPGMAVLGHSAGALLALTYAADYPSRVERLVLVGGAARFAVEHAAIAEQMVAARSHEAWYAEAAAAAEEIDRADHGLTPTAFGELITRAAGFCYASYGPRQVAHASLFREEGVNVAAWLALDDNEDLRPLLPRIAAPTLVVVGEQDCVLPPAASHELADGLANGRIILVPDAGHYPWVDRPDFFAATVSAFLRNEATG
jgi:proline iminopeptidase